MTRNHKICSTPACFEKVISGEICRKCYFLSLTGGTKMPQKCLTPDCLGCAYARGICQKCYLFLRNRMRVVQALTWDLLADNGICYVANVDDQAKMDGIPIMKALGKVELLHVDDVIDKFNEYYSLPTESPIELPIEPPQGVQVSKISTEMIKEIKKFPKDPPESLERYETFSSGDGRKVLKIPLENDWRP